MMAEKNTSEVSGVRSQTIAPLSVYGGQEGQIKDFLDMTKLVRSVQRAEGNPDCFGKAQGYCDRLDCAWYRYCVGKDPDTQYDKGRNGKT